MLAERNFQIVLVGENHGVGILPERKLDKVLRYSGKEIAITP
jgi:hypothetical protein